MAISLHGPDDQVRNQLIPAGKSAGVQDLVRAARAYARETGRRLTFEYALIGGVNDSPAQADQLAKLLAGTGCHVNLIPWNPVAEIDLKPSAPGRAAAFMDRLEKGRVNVTLRRALGPDIAAACGQLRMQDAAGGDALSEQRQDSLTEE
jgi:23S rRNA (adenine2503-C2)-methyltransferase